MPSTKPTVLIVHGAWHQPSHFTPFRELLKSHGFDSVCPKQPSFNTLKTTMYEDAAVIREEATKLVEAGKDVIVLMHSYGGVVGTEAIYEDLSKSSRQAKGLSGGVTSLLYMCAFVLPVGASLGTAFGGQLPPFIKTEDDGSCNMLDPGTLFYNDLSEEDKAHWLAQTKPHPAIAQLTSLTYAAYRYIPTTYLVTEIDVPLPIQAQEGMIAQAEASYGIQIKKETCKAGHSPYLSQPEKVVEVIEGLV